MQFLFNPAQLTDPIEESLPHDGESAPASCRPICNSGRVMTAASFHTPRKPSSWSAVACCRLDQRQRTSNACLPKVWHPQSNALPESHIAALCAEGAGRDGGENAAGYIERHSGVDRSGGRLARTLSPPNPTMPQQPHHTSTGEIVVLGSRSFRSTLFFRLAAPRACGHARRPMPANQTSTQDQYSGVA